MSRKKVNKKTKLKKATAATKTGGITLIKTLEKNFVGIPAKLITQCRKDLTGFKAQEKKVGVALNKANVQKEGIDKKISALLAKTGSSATAKKKLTTYKRTLAKITATVTGLTNQLNQLNQTTQTLALKQGTYSTIQKQLSALEKEWSVKHKIAATVTKKRKKKTRKATATPGSTTTYETTTPSQGDRTIISDTEIETIE